MLQNLPQRKESTFNYQTAKRLTEFLCIDLAMQEVVNDGKVWEYFDRANEEYSTEDEEDMGEEDMDLAPDDAEMASVEEEEEVLVTSTGGTQIQVFKDEENDGEPSFRILSRSKSQQQTVWINEVIVFLNDLQNLVAEYINEPYLPVLTMHKRGDHVFYGHPNFRSSGPWKDWVIIDWGQHGKLPSHIWCFVKLSNMPTGNQKLQFGGVTLQDDVYAVVEVADYNEDEEEMTKSDLFTPLLLEVDGIDDNGEVTGRRFYLASTESFDGPCCVIPDIGGQNNAYFQVKPRREWTKDFIGWLEAPHHLDIMQYSDEEEEG